MYKGVTATIKNPITKKLYISKIYTKIGPIRPPIPKTPWHINIQNYIFPFFCVSNTHTLTITYKKQQNIEIKNKTAPCWFISIINENIPNKNTNTTDDMISIWWKVIFFYRNLKIIAPVMKTVDLQKNKNEYYVY